MPQLFQIGTITGDRQVIGAIELAQNIRQPENALRVVFHPPQIKQAKRAGLIRLLNIARQVNVPVQSMRDDKRARRIKTMLAHEIVTAAF